MLAARACDVRIARRAAHSRQQMRGRDRHDGRRLQHVALRAADWLDELEPTLTVAREHDRVTVRVGKADKRVVDKRWRKAAREVDRQHHRLTVAVGERRQVPTIDVQIGRRAIHVWLDVTANLIVIFKK